MNKQSYYKEITLQRYARQKARPLTSDSLLRRYVYPTEVFYGKTKQEFIDNNGEGSEGKASEATVEGGACEGRVPLVLEPQVLTQNITPNYAIEHGVIKAKLNNMEHSSHADHSNQLKVYVIGVYHWEFP
jgi:hypothetical protein